MLEPPKVTRLGRGSALLGGTRHRDGDRPFEPMNHGTHPEELPAEVVDDVASVVGPRSLLSRHPEALNGGAMRVQLAGRANSAQSSAPGTPQPPGQDVEPREWSSTCVGAAIPPRPGSEWGPQPLMYGI